MTLGIPSGLNFRSAAAAPIFICTVHFLALAKGATESALPASPYMGAAACAMGERRLGAVAGIIPVFILSRAVRKSRPAHEEA